MNETSTMLSHCKFYLFFFLLTSTRAFPSKLLSKGRVAHKVKASAIPIDGDDWPDRFPAKEHCSRCGLCETTFVSQVTNACAFIGPGMARIDKLEEQVHGRKRKLDDMTWSSDDSPQVKNGMADEGRFGVLHEPVKLARGVEKNAQWTGCVTGIALAMLESKMVDAVVCIASDPDKDWASPQPILAKTPEEVLRGRGVKPALAPSLKVLDEIQSDKTIRKLLFCGVGCAVQAFRAVQKDLDLEEVFVLGTNCADNSPTREAANNFIENGVKVRGTEVQGYEFMQDFKVHVKTSDSYITKPYFTLPGTIAKSSIANSCLACFDYTNGLADVVVGYMGAPLEPNSRMNEAYQTVTIRNERGAKMVQVAVDASKLRVEKEVFGEGSHEQFATATVTSDSIVMEMIGKEPPEKGMPLFLGEIMAFVMRNVGPKGTNFARYSIDYHLLRNYLHILDEWGERRANQAVPEYVRNIVSQYMEIDPKFRDLVVQIGNKVK